MKTTFLTLVLLVFGFSSFAFMPNFPAESSSEKNIAVTSEKPKSESETKTEAKAETKAETKTVTAKELTQKMEANYEATKSKMSFKERLANKFLIKKLQKAIKKDVKNPNQAKDSTALFHLLGILLIVLGIVSLLFLNLYGGIVTIVVGIFIYLLPELI